MAIPGSSSPPPVEVETAKCDSCGFTEDCTLAYIMTIRERFHGRWICGLCTEAVKDEVLRSERLISTEEALNRHISFCSKFRSTKPVISKTEHPHLCPREAAAEEPRSPENPPVELGQSTGSDEGNGH